MANTAGSKSAGKCQILYGEGDAEVLAAQAVSMQKAGYEVEQAVGRKGVEEALERASFDLVVLGSTLNKNDRHHLPYLVKKKRAATVVLVLHADGGRHPQVDASLDSGKSMEAVLEAMAAALKPQKAARGAAAGV